MTSCFALVLRQPNMTAYVKNCLTILQDAAACASVCRNQTLYTFNAQCPEGKWADDNAALEKVAASFILMSRRT